MTRKLNRKQLLILSGALLVILLLFTFLYFSLLSPIKKEREAKTTELTNEEEILEMVQAQAGGGTDFESTAELQKRIPVKPLTDQFLLNLEKAEVVSNSLIENMTFADGETTADTAVQTEEADDETEKNDETDASKESDEAEEQKQTETETEPAAESVPSETGSNVLPYPLKKVSASMNVKSSSYEEMLAFIEAVQSGNRVMTVDNLAFTGSEEIKYLDDNPQKLDYQLTVSAYYYPTLTDLQKQLPTIDSPKPSGKANPLSGNESEEENENDGEG